ncbi:TIGR04024 family LLM class F420-dependent oxidoreductase [Halocalculus aciditolerans]|uniref:LLM class F420-dependent oxidoreductase n=1 Tax=Halocalculus aciditolerans TaxID=1383812 RepID=A0A830F596_9EURY|nr:TIGR04024 family LLM class F420-dependent oxidoreductase [Halocalculus aciditolerans]GGL55996.1 LLM class F420-dependent oxidoreductase [Halocalculus aciditolerans]
MTERGVHLPVAAQDSFDDLVRLGERAEELGYDRVALPETWGRDGVAVLSALAERTEKIGLASSILNTYSRSPALLGQTAATLQEASDGRFRLGIGPSGPVVVENWHGVDYGNPLRRTRETVEVVKQVLSGDTVTYDGSDFSLSGFRLRCDAPDPAPPVDVTGMGPKAVELAGRFADGWHALMLTDSGLDDRLADLERGAALGDRDPDDIHVTLVTTCCALDDPEEARNLTRQHIGFYVGGMGTFYRDALERQGYGETANAVYEAWQDGDHAEAVGLVGDDLLDDVAAAGTPEEARDRLAALESLEGVDEVAIGFPRAADQSQIDATMDALAPER